MYRQFLLTGSTLHMLFCPNAKFQVNGELAGSYCCIKMETIPTLVFCLLCIRFSYKPPSIGLKNTGRRTTASTNRVPKGVLHDEL
ncbi:hypothetical protein DICVIV_11874 [Dictyocaulus viviparus]|uniref:Uncharacterized protein n=1 Tax=Dictyocaulus viviparus TaxID=29172 RepID=A0A0D8XC16_DICVI|nr:hypothetical protein DICVIV_11874 [Dictyocaulus viviparus]